MGGWETGPGATRSLWMATAEPLWFAPLAADTSADVCVVGAGIAGLSIAYLLARAGRSVVVLERGPVGGGETARTTAHLSFALDDRYYELERQFGRDGARLAAESHRAAVDCIEAIVRQERIECDFRRVDGYLFAPPFCSDEELRTECEAARRAGVPGVDMVARAPLPLFETGPALRFPNQGQFHPLQYLAGLARGIVAAGGRIFTGTHVSRFFEGSVRTAAGPVVTAGAIALATNTPEHDNLLAHVRQGPYRTYVICGQAAGGAKPALYWDTGDPYHYVRWHGEHLIVGGEDHRSGEEDDGEERFDALEEWTRERFPLDAVEHRWSGQVMEPVDGMGLIGHDAADPPSLHYATGDSGHGMTHGTIAGILIADLVLGRTNNWRGIYNPSRIPVSSDFLQENADIAWHFLEWITSGDVGSEDAIEPGEGAVVRRGLSKCALYRDDGGRLHERSAVCPHLGCIVAWNSAEQSWNCPCHGSRFDAYGRVTGGPARRDLA